MHERKAVTFQERPGYLKLLIAFSRETRDNVTSQKRVILYLAEPCYYILKMRAVIGAVYPLYDLVGRTLDWDMKIRLHPRILELI